MLDTNLTIEQIQSRLAHIDNFNLRRNIVVPNVSWGLLSYEADFICCSKSGYLTEVEIKRSWEDFQKEYNLTYQVAIEWCKKENIHIINKIVNKMLKHLNNHTINK